MDERHLCPISVSAIVKKGGWTPDMLQFRMFLLFQHDRLLFAQMKL
jgi:hypothetical protein